MTGDIKRGDIYIVDFDPPKGQECKATHSLHRVAAMSREDFRLVGAGVKEALGFGV